MVDGRTSCGAAWHDPNTTSPLGVTVDADSAVCSAGRAPSQWSVAPSRAVWLTLTAVQATSIGFVVAYPAGVPKPATSDLNPVVRGTVANSGPVGLGTGGTIQIYSSAGFRNTGSTLHISTTQTRSR
jgi:hypothetical protein